jgi:glutaredoxin-like protein
LIPLRDQQVLRERFQRELTSRLRIDYFTQKPASIFIPGRQECAYCADVQVLMEEVASLSERITLTVHDIDHEPNVAKSFGIDKVPGIVIRGQTNRPLRYFGVPAGSEFPGFIETLLDAARGTVTLLADTAKQLRKLKSDVHLQVMVTPTCPYCPALARTAAKLALQNVRVKLDVVEVSEFPQMAQHYGVRVVPTTVINDTAALPGAMDESTLLENIFRIVEGKPITRGRTPAPASAFAVQTSQKQQQPQETVTASGLIVPGR